MTGAKSNPSGDIRLDGARLDRGEFVAEFDLTVEAGRLVAILGPSGSGKSTLLSLVAGFETPDHGTVRIAGRNVTTLGPAERPVSMVFQDNNLFAHLDVRTNVGLGLRPTQRFSAAELEAVEDALARVGLAGFGARRPGDLSGGERQRVALARVLVRRHPVLLLDEAFASLGPGLRADMLRLVDELRHEAAMTVLMVTHSPDDATLIADDIVFIDRGRIAGTGRAAGFFERTDIEALPGYLGGRTAS